MSTYRNFVTENARFAMHSGIELIEVDPGYAKAKMSLADYHLNALKMVHGGAIFTLADFACAVAANSRGTAAVGVNVSIAYIIAPQGKVLYAEAREVSLTSKLGVYTVNVTDEDNVLVAIYQATAYRKKEKIELTGKPKSPEEFEPGIVLSW